jgi:HK97 family phage portal protein
LADRVQARTSTSREVRRATSVTLQEFADLLAGGSGGSTSRTKAGVSVGANRAMGNTAWKRGVTYLTESVAGLPWHHYVRLPDDGRERRARQPWLAAPDLEQTWYGIVEYLMVAMLNRGNGFCFKLRNGADQVVGLREIHPDRVTTGIAPDGTKRFLVDKDPFVYTTREILHVPGMVIDGGRFGCNPIAMMADSLGAVIAADDYSQRFFASGTHVGGIISVPQALTADQAKDWKHIWDSFHEGLVNAHKTGVLSGGATYNRISLSAAESQLLEARQFGVTEVCRMLGVAPHKLYELSRSTNNNIEHQGIEAVTDSIRPWTQRIENALNADVDLVLPGHYVEAELAGLMRGDSAAIAASLGAQVTGGWMMPSTAARLQNLPSPTELDYYLRPLNMAVLVPGQGELDREDGAEVGRTVARFELEPAPVAPVAPQAPHITIGHCDMRIDGGSVNVEPAEPANITVNVPEQPAPVVTVNVAPAEARVQRMSRRVERDERGHIIRIVEE